MNKPASLLWYVCTIAVLGTAIAWAYVHFLQHADVGDVATDSVFSAEFEDLQGNIQSLKQYQNKPLVLNFWATWCGPCRDEMPDFSRFYDENHAKGLQVLGLAVDDVASMQDFAKEVKVSYPLLSAEVHGMALAEALGNDKGVLPYTVIINADGSVKKVFFGRVSRQMLDKALVP